MSLKIDVDIVNHEALKSVKFSIEGFVAVVGPTHSGKSAMVRALTTAVTNRSHPDAMRKGSSFIEVHLKYQYDEREIDWLWTRAKSPTITYNGDLYSKLNRETPVELLTSIGFAPVVVEGKTYRPQFQNQLSSLFGIGPSDSGTTLFSLVLSLSNFDKVPDARKKVTTHLKNLKEKELRLEGELGVYEKNVEEYTEDLEKLNDPIVVEFEKKVAELESYDELRTLLFHYEELTTLIISLESYIVKMTNWMERAHLVNVGYNLLVSYRFQEVKLKELKEVPGESQFDDLLRRLELKELFESHRVAYRDLSQAILLETDAEGRIERLEAKIEEAEKQSIECSQCGAPIKDGRYVGPKKEVGRRKGSAKGLVL